MTGGFHRSGDDSASTATTPSRTRPSGSAADRALNSKVTTTGSKQASRSQATNEYRSTRAVRNSEPGGRYQTQGYVREPAARPSYIPQTTYVGGRSFNIIFVPGFGYGYYDPYGAYVPYMYSPPFYHNVALDIFLVIVLVVVIGVVLGRRGV